MVVAAKEAGIKHLKIQDIKSNELTNRKEFDRCPDMLSRYQSLTSKISR